jgi:hypothetical protein
MKAFDTDILTETLAGNPALCEILLLLDTMRPLKRAVPRHQ